ncbi:hypothetical protein OS493_012122 [Desmophyllum pertusum]|uniref:Uncharacterized protein n=1 Tax=Desmophyllum pertusum TaxID=174260 RepID=A0A9X0DBB4_9CNID|nr:hypothetical protein OS493_012122 [Desmophyllum pertusum]
MKEFCAKQVRFKRSTWQIEEHGTLAFLLQTTKYRDHLGTVQSSSTKDPLQLKLLLPCERNLFNGDPHCTLWAFIEEDHRRRSQRKITEEDHRRRSQKKITEEDHRRRSHDYVVSVVSAVSVKVNANVKLFYSISDISWLLHSLLVENLLTVFCSDSSTTCLSLANRCLYVLSVNIHSALLLMLDSSGLSL